MHEQSIFLRSLKEPLLHFLLIGIGLFILFSQSNTVNESNNKQKIIIDISKITMIFNVFMEENEKLPTSKELQNLVDKEIREEVLYHEAVAMGLDKNDKIIRHRLAEKMSYLFEDINVFNEPSEDILKAYFLKNSEMFIKLSTGKPKYNDIKQLVKNKWLETEQKKENEIFYENLKSNYTISITDDARKKLGASILK